MTVMPSRPEPTYRSSMCPLTSSCLAAMTLAGALAPLVREVRLGRSHSLEPSLGLLAAVTTAAGGKPQEGAVQEAVAGSGVLSLCAQLLFAVSGWVSAGAQ